MTDKHPQDSLSPIKRAFLAIEELQAKLAAIEYARREPIAVVGMACRFPGGADSPTRFWELLVQGYDAMRPVPVDRWDNAAVYSDTIQPGHLYTTQAAFINNIREFDATFFGIPPREAAAIDPQQRILLEVTWEALEDAGQVPTHLAGSSTGVFIGSMTYDYLQLQLNTRNLAHLNPHIVTGSGISFAAGRISYILGLQGPSMVVDSACSSSLLSIHLAVQSLRNGECNLALAGGVNAMLTPQMSIIMSQLGALSPDNHCRTFDASADGYARGEGCGIIVLKRLSDALADEDRIYGVIRGSATNHDGPSGGLTVPNGPSQQALMQKALKDAGVLPHAIQYLETHGTGTNLGDPIELGAVAAVYGKNRSVETPLLVGSVKTNIGHLEGAAGISGLIKLILSLQHNWIAPHCHFNTPNPYINWDQLPIHIATEGTSWQNPTAQSRMGAVSSFGLSGTNVHMIVEEAPSPRPAMHAGGEAAGVEPLVLLLSAHTPQALLARLMHWQQWLPTQSSTALPAILATAATRRTAFAARCALVVPTAAELPAALARATPAALLAPSTPPRLAFIFSGQAPLDPAMLLALRSLPQTAAILDAGAAQLAAAGIDLWAMLTDPLAAQFVRSTDRAQPLLLLLQVALVAWWSALGVTPHAVVGHSVGEFAAAVTAGVLDLATALDLTLARGALLTPLHGQGAMLAVGAAAEQVREVLEQQAWASEVVIAAVNSPRTTVIAGTHAALAAAAAYWRAAGVFTRDVGVEYAFHSPQLDPLLPAWRETVAGIAGGATSCAFYSTVTGTVLGGDALDGGYWEQQLRAPVQFGAAVQAVLEDGIHVLVEIGPGATLQAVLEQGYAAATVSGVCIASLVGQQAPALALRTAAGRLWEAGVAIKWTSIFPDPGPPVALPTYPWQRTSYWIEPPIDLSISKAANSSTTLLGEKLRLPLHDQIYEQILDSNHIDGLIELYETPIFSYGHMIENLCQATYTLGGMRLAQIEFDQNPVSLRESRTIHTILRKQAENYRIEVTAHEFSFRAEDSWYLCAVGISDTDTSSINPPSKHIIQQCTEQLSLSALFQQLDQIGWQYLEQILPVAEIWRNHDALLLRLNPITSENWIIGPQYWETLIQFGALLLHTTDYEAFHEPALPSAIKAIEWFHTATVPQWAYIVLNQDQPTPQIDAWLLDNEYYPIALAQGITYAPLSYTDFLAKQSGYDWIYNLIWQERPIDGSIDFQNHKDNFWIILQDQQEIGYQIGAAIKNRGHHVEYISTNLSILARNSDDNPHHINTPDDLVLTLKNIQQQHNGSCSGIIDCRALNIISFENNSTSEFTNIINAYFQVIKLIQTLLQLPEYTQSRVWLITRGAQLVNQEQEYVALQQAALWGLGRAIALEQPMLWGGLIDLDPAYAINTNQLLAEFNPSSHTIHETAFRNERRYEARLVRAGNYSGTKNIRIYDDATYLITGGLGGLGLEAACALADAGARSLVLVGRRKPKPIAQDIITRLTEQGIQVTVFAADISIPVDVEQVFTHIDQNLPKLRGILHLAGQTDDALITQQSIDSFARVFQPKLIGGWLLHQQTYQRNLDFFVLFSSAAALFGAIGRSNYAAANAFLDGLADYRQLLGLSSLSLNWGAWSDTGMAAQALETATHHTNIHQLGMGIIKPKQGIQILLGIQTQCNKVGVFPMQWRSFAQLLPPNRQLALLESYLETQPFDMAADHGLRRQLVEANSTERLKVVLEVVLSVTRVALNLETDAVIDKKQPFNQYGIDSIMALDIRKRLQLKLGINLPATLLFDYPTAELLTKYLSELFMPSISDTRVGEEFASPNNQNDRLDTIEHLSDEEVDALFARILEQEGLND